MATKNLMSAKMGKRLTARKPDTVRRQSAKTDGAFGKETADQVTSGNVNRNEDNAVKQKQRTRRP